MELWCLRVGGISGQMGKDIQATISSQNHGRLTDPQSVCSCLWTCWMGWGLHDDCLYPPGLKVLDVFRVTLLGISF